MRTYTVVERAGEWLGPVDWSYDFDQHSWGPNRGGVNPERVARGREMLRKLVDSPGGWRYSRSGLASFEVVHVGMYDGWPFWRPTPAIGYRGPLGSIEVAFFYDLSEYTCARESLIGFTL